MSVYLFSQLPDEHLVSNVARYADSMLVGNWPKFVVALFGYQAAPSAVFPYNLDYLASQTSECWGISGRQLAMSMTLLPYYLAFANERERAIMEREVLERQPGRHPTFMMKAIRRRKTLSYCPECLKDDTRSRRPMYWRRRHQLPGAFYCDEHGCRLYEQPIDESRALRWPLAMNGGSSPPVHIEPRHEGAWRRVAALSSRILDGQLSVCAQDRREHWRNICRNAGFGLGEKRLRKSDLRDRFTDFFGEKTLAALGLYPASQNNWICDRLWGKQTAMAPLADVLLDVFSEELASDSSDAWPYCMSRVAHHGPYHPVRERVKRGEFFYATCECGFSIRYRHVIRHIPQDVEVTVYGPTYRSAVSHMTCSGSGAAEISRRLHVAETTLRRWMSGRSEPMRLSFNDASTAVLQDEWKVLLHRCGSAAEATRRCNALWTYRQRRPVL